MHQLAGLNLQPKLHKIVARRLDRTLVPKPSDIMTTAQYFPDFIRHAETWLDVQTCGGGIRKACFHNALECHRENRNCKIYVGYGLKEVGNIKMAFEHAWCVDGDKVIDTTWQTQATSYVGVPVVDYKAYAAAIAELGFGVSQIMQSKKRKQMFGF